MPQAKGSRASLRLYEQTSLATEATGPGLSIPLIDTDLGLTQGLAESRVLQGSRNRPRPGLDEKSVGGGFTMQPDLNRMGWILKHLFGLPVTTGAGPVYTHEFKLQTSAVAMVDVPPNGLTLEKWYGDISQGLRYKGCKLNGLSFDVGSGGILEARVDVLGIDESTAVTAIDAAPYSPVIAPFRIPSVTLSEGGASLTSATRFSLTLGNNMEETRVLGNGGVVADLPEGLFTAEGTLSVLFDSMALYNKAKAGTESALILTFPSTVAGRDLVFEFPEVMFSVRSPGIAGPGGVTVDLDWRAYFEDGASFSMAVARLRNTEVSYSAAIPA